MSRVAIAVEGELRRVLLLNFHAVSLKTKTEKLFFSVVKQLSAEKQQQRN